MEPWTVTVTVAVSSQSPHRPGSSIEVCEGPNDHHSAYQDTGTYRGAAAICGTTPKTVKRVIERAEAGDARPLRKERTRNYEAMRELVKERVKKSSGRITAKRLLPAARTAGYAGSDRNFRRLVAAAKKDWRAEHHRGGRPAIWSPGEHLVIDWGSQGGVHVFCAR